MESEQATPCGKLKITCNELEISLVLSTGEIFLWGTTRACPKG